MAITVNPKVVISAVDKYSGVFGNFGKDAKAISIAILGAETAIAAFSVKLGELSVKLGIEATQAAIDFNDAIFDISAVTGDAGASIGQISTILDES